ncbi:hypothetical protein R75465_07133 [Paraburkholderia aspalathi]|nr:hypothetical protein R75465_07133 [Paraburkholderia aspalathi]
MRFARLLPLLGAICILAACGKQDEAGKPQGAAASQPELVCDAACRAKTSGSGNFPSLDTTVPPDNKRSGKQPNK